ncbi:MAG: hypothetical protein HQM16_06505 [Deltaproteobacteria bacterium]|nr:hypothetical protein [Deltaproteobacteria bacterium]
MLQEYVSRLFFSKGLFIVLRWVCLSLIVSGLFCTASCARQKDVERLKKENEELISNLQKISKELESVRPKQIPFRFDIQHNAESQSAVITVYSDNGVLVQVADIASGIVQNGKFEFKLNAEAALLHETGMTKEGLATVPVPIKMSAATGGTREENIVCVFDAKIPLVLNNSHFATKEDYVEVTGRTLPGAIVAVARPPTNKTGYDDNASTMASGDGSFLIALGPTTIGTSNYEITSAKFPFVSAVRSATINKTAPVVELSVWEPQNNTSTAKRVVFISGKTEQGAQITVNNTPVVVVDNLFSYKAQMGSDEQTYYFAVKAVKKDRAEKTEMINITRKLEPVDLSISQPHHGETVTQPRFYIKGKTEQGASVTVNDNPVTVRKGNFIYEAQVGMDEGAHNFTVKARAPDRRDAIETVTINRVLTEKEVIAKLRSEYSRIDYKLLIKNPDLHKGEKAVFTGKVVQIQEDETGAFIRVAIYHRRWGYYDYSSIIAAFIPKTNSMDTGIVEDDVQTFYGTIMGTYTYTSQARWDISIPSMQVDFFE